MKNITITFILAIFFCLIFTSNTLNANSDCSNSFMGFSSSEEEKTYTRHFISYLSHLFEEGTIDLPSLKNFMNQLKEGKLVNPISDMDAETNPTRLVAFNAIQDDFESTYLLPTEILIWLHKFISQKKLEEDLKNQAVTLTNNSIFPITFNRLKLNENTYIEVMNAPVTEYQWAQLMGEFHLKHHPSEAQEYIHINGKDYFLNPNHLMFGICFWDGLRFANELSLQQGYYPFYNFDHIDILKGANTYFSGKLYINTRETFPNQTPGFRLPYPDELYFLIQNKRDYLKTLDRHELDMFFENIKERKIKSRDLSTFKPIYVQNGKFLDILGTSFEWAIDRDILEKMPLIGVRITKDSDQLSLELHKFTNPLEQTITFRLVRDITREEYENAEELK